MRLGSIAAPVMILVLATAANAGAAEDLVAAINDCAAMPDSHTRYSCYDRLPALAKSLTAPAIPKTAAVAPAEKKPTASSAPGDESEPTPLITATVESFTFDYGVFVVTLDNGQVWRQVTSLGGSVHLRKGRKDRVTIWRNAFGDDILRIDGYRTQYHVRRIQ